VLGLGLKAAYHYSPLDARKIGHLAQQYGATVMTATPTFMRSYLQRCTPEQFATLRLLILGAEKLKPEMSREIEEALHVVPLQGYGCTETGPVVSVNVPVAVKARNGESIPGNRQGTVGRPLPGTEVRTVDPQTGAVLPAGSEGIIQVHGPQVMMGYLNQPDATAAVLRDGWYSTGDLGFVDDDGFLSITDRLNRFAKIGGEMVPHHAVESAIAGVAGISEAAVAVTSLPDPKRGERLVVLHTGLPLTPEAVCARLAEGDTPRLWIPSASDFLEVEALPVLGTGKLDLREIRRLAEARLVRAEA
jgi:acyl-[acyl-carrier-protein]-phospholipid O-acyltransferase/long-chain-fatty-acid--[acyl-carrier-protein] ligase